MNGGYLVYDVVWQVLYVVVVVVCRGSIFIGGSGIYVNEVLIRNSCGLKSCIQFCVEINFVIYCDVEVFIYGKVGKVIRNGQNVGLFYNYDCNIGMYGWGGEEVKVVQEGIMGFNEGVFSFCCCCK